MEKPLSTDARKKALAEEIWLQYFNNRLFEAGIITEAERNRMINRIMSRNTNQTQS